MQLHLEDVHIWAVSKGKVISVGICKKIVNVKDNKESELSDHKSTRRTPTHTITELYALTPHGGNITKWYTPTILYQDMHYLWTTHTHTHTHMPIPLLQ